MSKPTKKSWDKYVSENIQGPDPVGYLDATQDILKDLKAFINNSENACDLQQKIIDYVAERHEFAEFGFNYMESGNFLKHVDPEQRHHYSLPWLKPFIS